MGRVFLKVTTLHNLGGYVDPMFEIGFPWDSLRDEAKVVDIGGGVGTMCMMVATKHPKLNFVVQDGPHVVNAKPVS